MDLIQPILRDQELVAEMDAWVSKSATDFQVWWLGQSGFLIQWKGQRVLLDPYLSDSLSKKYETTDKPHKRISECVIDPSLLRGISVISSSHNHTDHLDAETILPILENNSEAVVLIPAANLEFAANRLSLPITRLTPISESADVRVGDFLFQGVPAAHNKLDRDAFGNCLYMGYLLKFGSWTIYHSGDTLLYPGMEELLKPHKIDLALLPINGNEPARRVAGNLNATEAVQLAGAIGAAHIIPCHYHLFEFNTVDPAEFEQLARNASQPYTVLPLGGRWQSNSL